LPGVATINSEGKPTGDRSVSFHAWSLSQPAVLIGVIEVAGAIGRKDTCGNIADPLLCGDVVDDRLGPGR